jgi:hypothetical protein
MQTYTMRFLIYHGVKSGDRVPALKEYPVKREGGILAPAPTDGKPHNRSFFMVSCSPVCYSPLSRGSDGIRFCSNIPVGDDKPLYKLHIPVQYSTTLTGNYFCGSSFSCPIA